MIGRNVTSPAFAAMRAALRPAAVVAATSVVTLGATTVSAHANATQFASRQANRWASSPSAIHALHGRPHLLRNGSGGANRPRRKAAAHRHKLHSHRWKTASRAIARFGHHGATTPRVLSGAAAPAALAVRDALAQLGKPYAYGKAGPWAFDCSGLTQHAWRAAGVHIPRTS